MDKNMILHCFTYLQPFAELIVMHLNKEDRRKSFIH